MEAGYDWTRWCGGCHEFGQYAQAIANDVRELVARDNRARNGYVCRVEADEEDEEDDGMERKNKQNERKRRREMWRR